MVNDTKPVLLTVLALALGVIAVLILQPYSADWPGTLYAKPARQYIRAALQQDSSRLTRLSASDASVRWALGAARKHGDSLVLWAGRIRAWTGARSGDTTEVFVYPPSEACSDAPIVFRFVGLGKQARVLSATSRCLGPE